jgi:hypothetical protein
MSGCEAAHHLNLWLKGEQTNLRGYSQAMRRRWGDSMAWGRRIAQVFYRFPGVGINSASNDPPHLNALHKSCRVRWGTATSRRE